MQMFFSLDWLVTKNQILNTKSQLDYHNLKGEEDSLVSSHFDLKWQQKPSADIWCLVFGFLVTNQSNERNKNDEKKILSHVFQIIWIHRSIT